MNWKEMEKEIEKNLETMHVPYQKREPEPTLANFIDQCGYTAHPMIVNLESLETVDADIGVIVTNSDESTNNGVYIFCVLKDNSMALITVIPSTKSKGPMIRKAAGDLTNAITGVILPPLTAFDMVEIVGQVIANTVIKDLISAFRIPKEKEQMFICMYLPKFLANVAMYHTGAADKDGKPMVNEEIVDMEPAMIRKMILEGKEPEIFHTKEKGNKDNAG